MERPFKTLKVERVYQIRYESRAQARIDLVNWIEGLYNSQRLHTSIDFQVPNILEKPFAAAYSRVRQPSHCIGKKGYIMNARDDIKSVIYASMRELNYQLPKEGKLIEAPDTILVGEGGVLDSLGLITLLVNIEQALSEKYHLAAPLLDVLMAEHEGEHPFHDVAALTNWVVQAQSDSRKAG